MLCIAPQDEGVPLKGAAVRLTGRRSGPPAALHDFAESCFLKCLVAVSYRAFLQPPSLASVLHLGVADGDLIGRFQPPRKAFSVDQSYCILLNLSSRFNIFLIYGINEDPHLRRASDDK
jgi:hypothetical protein